MLIDFISFAILLSAVVAIISHYWLKRYWFYIFKPLTTILIGYLAYIVYQTNQQPYSFLILISLPLALVGDILLVNYKYLKQGLISFAMVHFGLILAMSATEYQTFNLVLLFPLILFGIGFYSFLWSYLKGYRLLIGIYMLIILAMNWYAVSIFYATQTKFTTMVALGSVLFTLSDSIIALNLFKKRMLISELLILSTYWLAIFLLTYAAIFL